MSEVDSRDPGREKIRSRSLRDEHCEGDGEQRPGARGLSEAARERRSQGQAAQRNRRGDQDLLRGRGILAVGQDQRSADLQAKMAKAYIDLWGSSARRLAGEAAQAGDRTLAARQALQGSGVEIEPVLRFRDATLSADHAMGAGPGAQRRRARRTHPQEGGILRPADHQRAGAVEFRAHQSGSAARDAGLQRRQPRSRHEDAGGGHRGRPRHAADPAVRPRQSRGRRQHGDHAGQGDLPERTDAADPVHADDGNRAAHAAADRAALDQQVLHPRSQAGEVLHQMVRRSGHHRVRDLVGQPGQEARPEDLRRLHEARSARGDGRHRDRSPAR